MVAAWVTTSSVQQHSNKQSSINSTKRTTQGQQVRTDGEQAGRQMTGGQFRVIHRYGAANGSVFSEVSLEDVTDPMVGASTGGWPPWSRKKQINWVKR